MGIGNTLFSKQISKLYFQSSIQVYSLLEKTEGQRKAFFGGCKKEVGGGGEGGALWDSDQEHLVVKRNGKAYNLVKFEIVIPSFLVY